jgi:PAS domain S-box-containing protein
VAAYIESCLTDHGFEVTGVAASAESALLKASKARPDLVLIDVRIRGEADGIETGELLRSRFGVPIIYLSGQGDRETIERAKKTRPLGFLLKPFKAAELTNAVEIALDRARAERELRDRESSFLLALESTPDAVLSTDEHGTVSYINRAAATLTGWTQEEAAGRHITEIVIEVDKDSSRPVDWFLTEPSPVPVENTPIELHTVARDGTQHWVSARTWSIEKDDGRFFGVVVLREITRRKELLRTLRWQSDLLEQAHEPILTRRLRGAITFWNRGAEQLYGFSRDEAIGSTVPELLKTEHPQGAGAIEFALEQHGRWSGELLQTTKGGRQIVVEALLTAIIEPSGRAMVLETHRDVTERRRVDNEIRRLNAELEQRVHDRTAQLEASNKELEAFAYSVSHDLRAPLRGIDGWSLALQEEYGSQLDQQACGYLDRVRTETQRMGLLIDDLLQLSRVTRSEMQFERVDLSSIAGNVAARLREAQPARPMDFLIAPGLTVLGDARLLEIALSNLLGNAAKFTAPRCPARIEFGQTENNGERVFYVRDNGVGFDMAYASTLFGAFQRLHKASEFPGTGIGLATVQRVIRRHGGRVWAQSAPDQGATFSFTIGPPVTTPA